MNIAKVTGGIILGAALFISGGLFFRDNPTIEQQLATPAPSTQSGTSGDRGGDWNRTIQPIRLVGSDPAISTANLGAMNQGIIQTQQQTYNQMQQCVQNARQAQQAFNSLNARKESLDAQIRAMNQRLADIDTSSPRGLERRDALRAERNRLIDARTGLQRNLTDMRQQFNRTKSDCRGRINELRNRQRNAENQMNSLFNKSLNVNTSGN